MGIKRTLYVTRYKVPITREAGEEPDVDKITETPVGKEDYEFMDKESVEAENIMIKITEISQKVRGYNNTQIHITSRDKSRDYVFKKIITKQ